MYIYWHIQREGVFHIFHTLHADAHTFDEKTCCICDQCIADWKEDKSVSRAQGGFQCFSDTLKCTWNGNSPGDMQTDHCRPPIKPFRSGLP